MTARELIAELIAVLGEDGLDEPVYVMLSDESDTTEATQVSVYPARRNGPARVEIL